MFPSGPHYEAVAETGNTIGKPTVNLANAYSSDSLTRGDPIDVVPRMLRNAPPLRRGALLIRGPRVQKKVGPGSAAQR